MLCCCCDLFVTASSSPIKRGKMRRLTDAVRLVFGFFACFAILLNRSWAPAAAVRAALMMSCVRRPLAFLASLRFMLSGAVRWFGVRPCCALSVGESTMRGGFSVFEGIFFAFWRVMGASEACFVFVLNCKMFFCSFLLLFFRPFIFLLFLLMTYDPCA